MQILFCLLLYISFHAAKLFTLTQTKHKQRKASFVGTIVVSKKTKVYWFPSYYVGIKMWGPTEL